MKCYITALIFILAISVSHNSFAQGSLAALDAKNGFRDLKFGMKRSQLKGMVLYKADGFGNYIRPSDKMMIGDIPVKQIMYRFYKGSLYSLFIIIDNQYESQVLDTFRTAYGSGQNSPRLSGFQNWTGKKVELCISHTTVKGARALHIEMSNTYLKSLSNKDFLDQENANEKAKVQKRQSDL